MKTFQINIKGRVQGVGFRPFVYNLALKLGITGTVANTSAGVQIYASGHRVDEFIQIIETSPPALADIDSLHITTVEDMQFDTFTIVDSIDFTSFTHISPDVSICDDCLGELFDCTNRRYLHPFINCTHCGPRYSITLKVPYDRINTTMAKFQMCKHCESEYKDITDRRFHAQPICCNDCGPSIQLVLASHNTILKDRLQCIESAINMLKIGAIVAIKGIGGFHLACDAFNFEAVTRLRQLKRKSNKPFAVMFSNTKEIAKYCYLQNEELALIDSIRRPIVLLRKKLQIGLSPAIAPNNSRLGVFLPYTALHYLIFYYPSEGKGYPDNPHFSALVMTSANMAEEPIIKDNDEALQRLSFVADAFLIHDRDIFMRVDDSVLKVVQIDQVKSNLQFIRRARGYVPEAIKVPFSNICALGTGAELKNTFTILQQDSAIMSQHIGDMQSLQSLLFYEETMQNLTAVYNSKIDIVCHDLHPEYMTTKWAQQHSFKTISSQHHFSHISAVMAEHGLSERVIGVALDGLGYGTDGTIWGSEFMIADAKDFVSKGRFMPIALPGADLAVAETFRIAIAVILQLAGTKDKALHILDEIGFMQRYDKQRINQILAVASQEELCTMSSGAGRFFDAVSALTGICDVNTFEGECAIALENLLSVECGFNHECYPTHLKAADFFEIDFSAAFLEIIDDIKSQKLLSEISKKFHNCMVDAVIKGVLKIYDEIKIDKVCLSGGVFQNEYVLRHCYQQLCLKGFKIYINELVPPNDACISLGQGYIARSHGQI